MAVTEGMSDEELGKWLDKGDSWEKAESRRAEEQFRVFQMGLAQEQQRAQEGATFEDRRTHVVIFFFHLKSPCSPIKASSIERVSASADHSWMPVDKNGNALLDEGIAYYSESETQQYFEMLFSDEDKDRWEALLALEYAMGVEMGALKWEANLTTDEINERIIADYEGYTPKQVSRLNPRYGTPRTIRQTRIKFERDPENGEI